MSVYTNLDKDTINYQCNVCGKKRLALIPPTMKINCDARGLCEFVDVHKCKDEQLSANVLFIDRNRAVRSQLAVSSRSDTTQDLEFAIPLPEKTSHARFEIIPDKNFEARIIRELEIKDDFRNIIYSLNTNKPREKIEIDTTSELGFISLSANITRNTTEEKAQKWLQKLVDLVEKTANLDENIFSKLIYFLDEKLKEDLTDTNAKTLDCILQSTISVPHAKESALVDFNQLKNSTFKKLTIVEVIYYTNILKICTNNDNRTLIEVYTSLDQKLPLFLFLNAVYDLVYNNLLEVDKLEFLSID